MSASRKVLWLALLLFAAGCGRSLAPRHAGSATPSGSAAVTQAQSQTLTPRLTFRGVSVSLARDLSPRVRTNESFYVFDHGYLALDTIAAYASLEQIQWLPGGTEATTNAAGSEAIVLRSTLADPQGRGDRPTFGPGRQEVTVHAPDRAGGGDIKIFFLSGFPPCSWFAGPDPDRWPASSDGDGRAVDVLDWATFATNPAWPPDGRPYFGPDSLDYIPTRRLPPGGDFERRTFYELRGDRIYARSEGDTVRQGSWIVVVLGGYDRDSRYEPVVVPTDPALPPGFTPGSGDDPVLQSLGYVGAPIAFRTGIQTLQPGGSRLVSSFSLAFPNFDPGSFRRSPNVAGYIRAVYAGPSCVTSLAQDADGVIESLVLDPFALVALVDAGGGTPLDRQQRRHVLTFHVAPAPQ